MAGHGPSAPETRKAGGTDNFGDTVDPDDIGRFAAQSAGWWDPEGSFRPLHLLNPIRLQFVRRELLASFGRDARALRPFEGLRLLDIGCGGGLVGATLNRTPQSFALAIIGAEYLLGWLPRGTHDWNRFVRPSEFVLALRRHGFTVTRLAGLSYEWRRGEWAEADDLSVNYMVAAMRR